MNRFDVSIVIACYNEAPHLRKSVSDILEVMDQTHFSYELIFVDDVSQDGTQHIIQDIASQNTRSVKILLHKENTGRGGAVSDGIRLSEGQYVGFLDIDLEVHARYIPAMVLALQNGYDVATAYRVYKLDLSKLIRHILSHGYRYLSRRLLKEDLLDTETGFKFFNRERILPILAHTQDKGWFWDTEIMVRALEADLKVIEIPCLFVRRPDKKSTVNLRKDIWDYLVKLYRFSRDRGSR